MPRRLPSAGRRGETCVSELLEVAAHGVTAILAIWLGLLVLTRAGRASKAHPSFSALCFLLVVWSVAIIVQRLGGDPSVRPPLNLVEDTAAFLLPAVTTHLAIAIASEGRRPPMATKPCSSRGMTLGIARDRPGGGRPGSPDPIRRNRALRTFGISSGAVAAWAFALAGRMLLWLAGIAYLHIGALPPSRRSDWARVRQLRFALATVILGVVGLWRPADSPGGHRWAGMGPRRLAHHGCDRPGNVRGGRAERLPRGPTSPVALVRWSLLAGVGIVAYVIGLDSRPSIERPQNGSSPSTSRS